MNGPVLVTGASGNVGGEVVRALQNLGAPVRAAGKDTAGLEDRFPGVAVAYLDFLDATTFAPALAGADALFLVRPPAIARVGPTLNTLLDVAQGSGVSHVVFSSVAGADTNPVVPHHRVETHLTTSELSWTILRPGFFAQNLAGAYRADIVNDGRIYLPAGHGRAAFIDTVDVGAVAAAVFADPSDHRGAGYALTGPRALDFDEVAALLTQELARPIRYQPAPVAGYVRHLLGQGLPLPQVLVQTALHTGLRRGQAEPVDPTLARLLGRSPRTLERYIRDNRQIWSPREQAAG